MEKEIKCPTVGGQAVIEGVMMKGTEYMATAVRKPTGEIVYRRKKITRSNDAIIKIPFIRGVFILIETLIMGIKELTFSAAQSGESEEDEISDFEIGVTLMIAFVLGILLFVVIPTGAASFLAKVMGGNNLAATTIEGALRVGMFLIYIIGISKMKDIQRVFQYHGAEHKSIYAFENKEELTVANAQKYSTLHPRCGTSFLLIVMVFSIFIFAIADSFLIRDLTGWQKEVVKHVSRLVLIPLVAGVAYEFQRFTSRHLDNPLIKLIAAPGMGLQKMTTRAPDDSQVEVAIVALKASLGEDISNAQDLTGIEKEKNKVEETK